MAIQHLSKHVLLVTLSADPQCNREMEMVIRSAGSSEDCDVIVDFSLVEILSSATLCNLMVLERLLNALDRQLILCSVPPNIDGVFTRVGQDDKAKKLLEQAVHDCLTRLRSATRR